MYGANRCCCGLRQRTAHGNLNRVRRPGSGENSNYVNTHRTCTLARCVCMLQPRSAGPDAFTPHVQRPVPIGATHARMTYGMHAHCARHARKCALGLAQLTRRSAVNVHRRHGSAGCTGVAGLLQATHKCTPAHARRVLCAVRCRQVQGLVGCTGVQLTALPSL